MDPRPDQGDEQYLKQLDDAFSAAVRKNLPKPNVDPYPPDFVDSTRPAAEADSRFKLPPPNVDPFPPDWRPDKP